MANQDRTSEFRAAVSSQLRILGGPRRPQHPEKAAKSAKSSFMIHASAIATDIADTTAMLQRLAQLAKRRAMFDDRPQEVTELTEVIKQKVSTVKEAIRALEPLAASADAAGGSGSVWASRKGREQVDQHSRNVVVSLQGKLKEITGDFAEVLEARSRNIQATRSRTDAFLAPNYSVAPTPAASNPLYRTPSPQKSALPVSEGYSENPYANAGLSMTGGDDVLELPQVQEQATVSLEDQQSSYLSQRSSAVDAIESTINELGSMFSQLSTMIAEQRETVQRIDANAEDISLSVSGAQREIIKYYARVSSNRGLMLKSFGVILFFFFLWVLIS